MSTHWTTKNDTGQLQMSITQKYNKRQKRHTYLVSPNLWKFIRISAAKRQRISWKLHKDSNPKIFTVKRTFSCYFCRFFRIVQGSLTYIVQLLSLDKIKVDPCLEISRHNVYFWNKVFFFRFVYSLDLKIPRLLEGFLIPISSR